MSNYTPDPKQAEQVRIMAEIIERGLNRTQWEFLNDTGDWRQPNTGVSWYVLVGLRPIRIKPEPPPVILVPLGPEDVPPGSVFRPKNRGNSYWFNPLGVLKEAMLVKDHMFTWAELMDSHEIKRPGEDWQPCSKPQPT